MSLQRSGTETFIMVSEREIATERARQKLILDSITASIIFCCVDGSLRNIRGKVVRILFNHLSCKKGIIKQAIIRYVS
jgi:hypothetical protein